MKGNSGSAPINPGAKGTRISFKITGIEDLKRRLVKVSNTGDKNCYSSYIYNNPLGKIFSSTFLL